MLRVLIIDDSLTTRQVIERTVRMADPEIGACFHAANGREALETLEKNWVDLIFCDLHMPEMNGREFIRSVRSNDIWKSIPIAVITSERSEETETEMGELGVDFYQKKPLTPEGLKEIFEALKERMP